jgi:signal transduction histidine kinase
MDVDLVSRGQPVRLRGLQSDGQGVANPATARRLGIDQLVGLPVNKVDGRLFGYFITFAAPDAPLAPWQNTLTEVLTAETEALIAYIDEAKKLSDVLRFMRLVTDERDVDTLWKKILKQALDLLEPRVVRGGIGRLDSETGQVEFVLSGGPPGKFLLPHGKGITGRVFRTKRPALVRDVEQDADYVRRWEDTKSELAIPLLLENTRVRRGRDVEPADRVIGVLNLESSAPAAFSERDIELLAPLANEAAAAIDRLHYEAKREQLRTLEAGLPELAYTRDAIDRIGNGLIRTLGAKFVNISLVYLESKLIRTEFLYGLDRADEEQFKADAVHRLDSSDIQADIYRSGKIEVPSATDERFDRRMFKKFEHEKYIRAFIPLFGQSNRVVGTLEVAFLRQYLEDIYEADIQIMRGFAGLIMKQLENKRKNQFEKSKHEFATPIATIWNHATYVRDFLRPSGELRLKISDIILDCEMLKTQLMELEYALLGQVPRGNPEQVSIFEEILVKSAKQLQREIDNHDFRGKITYRFADRNNIDDLWVDKARLNQVVYNLLMNAIKYGDRDVGRVEIEIEVMPPDKNYYTICFRDRGIGIPEEYKEQVFEEGVRTPDAQRLDARGTGLGLSISRIIMREMDGDLILHSPYDPTEFRILLPKSLRFRRGRR